MKKLSIILLFINCIFVVVPGLADELKLDGLILGSIFVVDDDGFIYVNSGRHEIHKYSPEGKFILKIGQKGEGPGDIRNIGYFDVNPRDNLIYVSENSGNPWISKFSKDGKYMGHWVCEINFTEFTSIAPIQFDASGNLYVKAGKTYSKKLKKYSLFSEKCVLLKLSPKGKKLKTIYRAEYDFCADKYTKGNVTIPFGNNFAWEILDDRMIISDRSENSISLYSLDGELQKRINLPFKKDPVTAADLDNWAERLNANPQIKKYTKQGLWDVKYWRRNLEFPKFKPCLDKFLVDSGNIFYGRKHSRYSSSKEKVWVKIDLDSGQTSVLGAPEDMWVYHIWKNHVFVRKYDENDDLITLKLDKAKVFSQWKRIDEK